MDRIEQIRKRIAGGSYEVPAADVAEAVVAFFSRDFPPGSDADTGVDGECC